MFRSLADLGTISRGAFEITPDDSNDLSTPARGLYIGESGDVKVTYVDGTTVTLVGMVGGVTHPEHVVRVWATGTTATGIVGKR